MELVAESSASRSEGRRDAGVVCGLLYSSTVDTNSGAARGTHTSYEKGAQLADLPLSSSLTVSCDAIEAGNEWPKLHNCDVSSRGG